MENIKKEILEKLNDIAIENIDLIEKDHTPYLKLKIRNKSNVEFDKKVGYIKLGKREEIREYKNIGQTKKYMQTIAVINAIKKIIEEGKIITIRDLFYRLKVKIGSDVDEKIFDEQNQSNSIIFDMEVLTGFTREELNVVSNPKGFMAGELIAEETFNNKKLKIDFSKGGSSAVAIAPNPDLYTFKECNAKYILFIEKYAVFSALNQEDFPKKHNALIVTSSGFPAKSVRRAIKLVSDKFHLPIYGLTDMDIFGVNIFTTLKYGSFNLAWESERVANPNAKFIGFKISDIYKEKYLNYILDNHLTMAITKGDISKSKIMLDYPFIKGTPFVSEINMMLDKKIKVESDVLASKAYNILEKYIVDNIEKKNYF